MQILTFPNDREYVKAQRRADESKSKRTSFTQNEINRIREELLHCDTGIFAKNPCMIDGICHGCRNGQEVDSLNLENQMDCCGTDLFPREYPFIVEWDFRQENPEWVNRFDFVYSNSLDHSDEPEKTLEVWSNQLRGDGVLLLQWSTSHRNVEGADCFGASLDEYMILVSKSFNIRDLLWIDDDCCKVIIIASKRKKYE